MLGRKLLMAGEASVTDFFNGLDGLSTFSRNLAASGYDLNGTLQTVPANVPVIESARWNGTSWDATGLTPSYMVGVKSRADVAKYGSSFKGYLNEPARTNVYFPSAAPATKTLTTTAQVYTISLRGIGSAVLSGTATGTVTTWGGPLTFTATAGTLTITVSGALTHCQIEAGAFATSPIVTTTAAVSRPATNLTRPTAGVLPVNNFGIWIRFIPLSNQSGWCFSSYTDSSNNISVLVDASNSTFRKRISGVNYDIARTNSTLNKDIPCEMQIGQSAASGMIFRVMQSGVWGAWVTKNDANGLLNAAIASTYQIGGLTGGTGEAANYSFLAVVVHDDIKNELERLATLYPT